MELLLEARGLWKRFGALEAVKGVSLALGPAAALGLGRFAYARVLPLMQAAWGLSYAEGGFWGAPAPWSTSWGPC